MKRLGICAVYDRQGIIDESVIYLLKEMNTVLSYMVIVCNGEIGKDGVRKLQVYADEVHFRPNIGYDVAAYKAALENYVGWDTVGQYDELVLFNTTFFGPFCPIQSIFDEMNKRKKDFWGLTRHGEMRLGDYHVLPHVQSYFLVISENLLHSDVFKEFWNSRKEGLEDIVAAIDNFEISFTRTFEQEGYSWDSYVDTRDLEGEDIENNFNPLVYLPYTLLKEYGLPILKKRLWPWTYTEKELGNQIAAAVSYIDRYTEYDANIIWRCMLRNADVNELRKALHLHFIVSSQKLEGNMLDSGNPRSAIIVCMEDGARKPEVPENCDAYYVEKNRAGNIGWSALEKALDLSKRYQYICFLHIRHVWGNKTPQQQAINEAAQRNLLSNKTYVKNIEKIFDDNIFLGILCPPMPYYGDFLKEKSNQWYYEYEEIESLIREIGIFCNISQESESPLTDFSFWCRAEVLSIFKRLEGFWTKYFIKNSLADEIVPRIIPYIAQHLGYYTAIIESCDFAGMHLEAINHLLEVHYLRNARDEKVKRILEFCRQHDDLYIYGAGKIGKRAEDFLNSHAIAFQGFVVSDDQWEYNRCKVLSHPIYPLKKIKQKEKKGILLALNARNAAEALEELTKAEITDYMNVDGINGAVWI